MTDGPLYLPAWTPHKRETWPWILGRLKKPVTGRKYLGYWDNEGPVMSEFIMEVGTLVRIVMVSRFGDVGITPNIEDFNGYVARVPLSYLRREL